MGVIQLDPRQSMFKQLYMSPSSPTFGNAYQSALKAGYKASYAENLLAERPEWVKEILGDLARIKNAEKAIDGFITSESEETDDKRFKLDASKFALKGLAREKYSERVEHTGADGAPLDLLGMFEGVEAREVIEGEYQEVEEPELIATSSDDDSPVCPVQG